MTAADRVSPRGGLIYRAPDADGGSGTRVWFIPSSTAREVTALSALTPIVGAAPPVLGIALAHGEVVTVLGLGPCGDAPGARPAGRRASWRPGEEWPVPGADRAVICDVGGDAVAITGGEVIATGVFDASAGDPGVLWLGDLAAELDVRALYARGKEAIWRARGPSGASIAPPSSGARSPGGAP